jgi:hypothetical protein
LFLKGWSYFYTLEFGTAPVLSEAANEQALDWISRLPNRVKLHDIIAVARTAWAASKEKPTQYDRFKAFRSASDLTLFLRNYEKIKGQVQFEGVTDQDWLDWEKFKKTLRPTEEQSLSV